MKSIFTSKTFWLAIAQASLGSIVIFSTAYPSVGALVIAKSVLDIFLRFLTTQPVTLTGMPPLTPTE
jgi:hypothetical protein